MSSKVNPAEFYATLEPESVDILDESYNVTIERLLEWSRNQQLINAMC